MLFLDMGSVDILHDFQPRFVLFLLCGYACRHSSRLGRGQALPEGQSSGRGFVQAGYRSSAAVLGVAFIQNIYGNAGMAPLMILGSVPLFSILPCLS